jgi:hypothetical protein
MDRLVNKTGGRLISTRRGIPPEAATAEIVDELRAQYALAFRPIRRDGKVHDLEIRIADRQLRVRGPKSYLAPNNF